MSTPAVAALAEQLSQQSPTGQELSAALRCLDLVEARLRRQHKPLRDVLVLRAVWAGQFERYTAATP